MLNIIKLRIYIPASYLRPHMLKHRLPDILLVLPDTDVNPRFYEEEIRILRACTRRRKYECH
jgi:hypothetical protein